MMSTEESNSAVAKKKLRAIQSFKKRKACILKKTMELSVLCDVEASAIVVEDNGVVSTWPENRCDVMNIINKYKAWRLDEKNKKSSELQQQPQLNEYDSSPLEELNLDDSFSFGGLSLEIIEQLLNDDDDHKKLLEEVEFKLQAVTKKIQFLKAGAAEEIHQGPHYYNLEEYRQHYYNLGEYHQYVPQQNFMVPTPTPTPLCMVPNPTPTIGMVPDPGLFGVADAGMMMPTPPTGMMMPTPGCFGIGGGGGDAGELTSFDFGYDFNYYFPFNAY